MTVRGSYTKFIDNNDVMNKQIKKSRNKTERFLDRYNHLMELVRTLMAIVTILLQLYLISKLL
jgi:hypothetical protein|tara:strand:+ start:1907 stop:2095 length:189 start_codon:yes stop_codon:yes gene_type:complete